MSGPSTGLDREEQRNSRNLGTRGSSDNIGESLFAKAWRIKGALALIILAGTIVASYFVAAAVLSYLGGEKLWAVFYAISATGLFLFGPFLVYKGLS